MRCWTHAVILVSIILLFQQDRVLAVGQRYDLYNLPPLYSFDKYDECLNSDASTELATTFCMVYAEIKPDDTSELWQKIKAHSDANPFNYRRDRLYFGLCMNRCLEYVKSLAFDPKSKFTKDDIVDNVISDHFINVHKRPMDIEIRHNYSAMIHTCLNDEFAQKYNLQLRTFVKYCETNKDNDFHQELARTDRAQVYIWRILYVLVAIILSSTFYDFRLKKQEEPEKQTNEFYQIGLKDTVPRVLTSFSMCRNYYRLIQPYSTKMANDLSFLDGFRSLTSLGVTGFHIIYAHSSHLQNPESMEWFGSSILGKLLLSSPIAIEIFLVMSGIFLFIKFTQSQCITPQSSVWKCIEVVARYTLQRFLRYLPSLGLLVLFNATLLSCLGDGPFWRHFMDVNRSFSRDTWWKNIFMINNFSHTSTVGPHTYYIGMDFQLYIFYTTLLVIMAKYPQHKYRILKIVAFLAVAIPTTISYFLKLGSLYFPKSESYRIGITFDSGELIHQYTPFYTNLGGYLVGICFGDFYLNYPALRLKVEEFIQRFTHSFIIALSVWGFGLLWLGSVMMFEEPSLKTAIFTGLHRNLWAVFVCGIPTLMGFCNLPGFFTETALQINTSPLLRFIARLTFQMFLWHFPIFKLNLAHMRQPVHMNLIYYLSLFLTTIITSGCLSFALTILVEYPLAQLLDRLKLTSIRKEKSEPTPVDLKSE